MQQHFATFYSPGTVVDETTTKPIGAWDIDKAVEMARSLVERYNAKPYGFQFSTRHWIFDELDSHEIARSKMYYLGGTIETRERIAARSDPKESILRDNLEMNDIDRVIVNNNSWRTIRPLNEGDVVLDVSLA